MMRVEILTGDVAVAYRNAWVRQRVEAWADRGLDVSYRGPTLFEAAWRSAATLYDEGVKLGFLPKAEPFHVFESKSCLCDICDTCQGKKAHDGV